METATKQIQFFWQWFEKHQIELKNLSKPVEPFWDVVLNELKKVDSRLWIELSAPASVPREFIVTAEGRIEAFAIAEALVGSAPRIEGWEFIALKPAKGFDFTTAYEGVLFEPKDMWFLPTHSVSRTHDIGLRVGIPNYDSMDAAIAHYAVIVILDTGLGERSAANDIHYLDVCALPSDPIAEGYIELPELAGYIRWWHSKHP